MAIVLEEKSVLELNVRITRLKGAEGSFTTRKKPIELEFVISDIAQDIKTKEGTVKCKIGDYILTGTEGEKWPIDQDKFLNTYNVKGNVCFKKPIDVTAILINDDLLGKNESIIVRASWGDLSGKFGDYIVEYNDNDFGVVGGDIFKKTYQNR